MKLYCPDYYTSFKCIADKCRHSCCVGWEIDIDEDTREFYRTVEGPLGERLKKGIRDGEDGAHFILGEHERCPFLNKDGLCDLITELGEESLCQICTDHPRFRSFYQDRIEIGLGLCCEEAARMILTRDEKTNIIRLVDDGDLDTFLIEEINLIKWRQQLINIVQDRTLPVLYRLDEMLDFAEAELPQKTPAEWAAVLKPLERLDHEWDGWLGNLEDFALKAMPFPMEDKWQTPLEQLAVYFLYRHIPGALEDGDFEGRAAFAALSVRIIGALLCLSDDFSMEELIDIARLYSSEIEYSDDNTYALLDELAQ
ncbi:MAG: flagellin lysine-N-methylase [Clostridia bacterium]|nr:flagellin lysine-N-methylase [Clostridia bacterium]